MRETRIIMGMPITIDVVDAGSRDLLEKCFAWFDAVDARFSTYKADSEISRYNAGQVAEADLSSEMKEVFAVARATTDATDGFFDMKTPGSGVDPSGIVKGWAIKKVADMLVAEGAENFFVDAGGDIQSRGKNAEGEDWRVGIRSPFKLSQVIKIVTPRGQGIATSGTYVRGAHIYNPHAPQERLDDVVSLTVIGPDVLDADRFATAAFAMGKDGIYFIEGLEGFEGYAVNALGIATQTSHFGGFVVS
jgi:thiamine biosynthesis lipoprotein